MLKSERLEKRVSMPKVVNFFDLIHLNERLAQQGLLSKVHLRDACGKQSLWIELPSGEKTDGREKIDEGKKIDGQALEKTKEQIEAFFAIKGMSVEFDLTGGKNFWIV